MDPTEITHEMVAKKLGEIVLTRGKKGIDRQDQVDMLAYLATVARGPAQKVRGRRCLIWRQASLACTLACMLAGKLAGGALSAHHVSSATQLLNQGAAVVPQLCSAFLHEILGISLLHSQRDLLVEAPMVQL